MPRREQRVIITPHPYTSSPIGFCSARPINLRAPVLYLCSRHEFLESSPLALEVFMYGLLTIGRAQTHSFNRRCDIHLSRFLSLGAFDVYQALNIYAQLATKRSTCPSSDSPRTFNIAAMRLSAVISHEPKHFGALFLYMRARGRYLLTLRICMFIFEQRRDSSQRDTRDLFSSARATLVTHTSVCVRLQTQLPVTNNTNKSPIALHINQPVNVSSSTHTHTATTHFVRIKSHT